VRQNGQSISNHELLVTKMFANNGYTAGLAGKLHISACNASVYPSGEPRIDDGYSSFVWSHHPDFYGNKASNWPLNGYNMWLTSIGKAYNRVPYQGSPYIFVGPDEEYSQSRWCADRAIDFIEAHEAYDQPWLFSLNFYDPHHDFDPSKKLLEKYIERLDESDLPVYQEGELENKTYYQRSDHTAAYDTPGFMDYTKMTTKDHLQVKAAYYAMVEQVDIEIGRVIEHLKESGQLENTIIVFQSDHGEMLGDHGIYLKGPYMYDCLTKVPLIINWPEKLVQGKRSKALVELLDIAPTLLDLAGIEVPPSIQGKSFKELLTGEKTEDEHKECVYSEYYNAMGTHLENKAYVTMIANHRYKLAMTHSTNEGELYDLENDPLEINNLYNDPAQTDTKVAMLEKLSEMMMRTIDPLPVRESFY
jgi:arylsulfatase A-like enzyme